MAMVVRPWRIFFTRILDHLFRLLVDVGSGLVQNEDLRLGSNGPSKSQKLTLTGR